MENNQQELPQSKLKLALAQMTGKDGMIEKNIQLAEEAIVKAGKKHVDLILFPEKFLTGYVPDIINSNHDSVIVTNDSRLDSLRELCRKYNITAIVGTPTKRESDLYISSIIIDSKGKECAIYDKMNLFYTEKEIYQGGDKFVKLTIKDWTLGLGICYDTGFSEHSRYLAQNGCHVYMSSALFSVGNGYSESRIWCSARALDNTIFVAMCNHVGQTGVWNACGGSGVWGPLGEIVSEASYEEEQLLVVELDPEKLYDARNKEHMLKDSRANNVTDKKMVELKIN